MTLDMMSIENPKPAVDIQDPFVHIHVLRTASEIAIGNCCSFARSVSESFDNAGPYAAVLLRPGSWIEQR
jgi:hypothetical protein